MYWYVYNKMQSLNIQLNTRTESNLKSCVYLNCILSTAHLLISQCAVYTAVNKKNQVLLANSEMSCEPTFYSQAITCNGYLITDYIRVMEL